MLRVFEDGRRNPHGSYYSAAAAASPPHYSQLCKALLVLQDTADTIFDTLSHRVGAEHQRLKGLSSRIHTAKAKVDAISGTKRAITVKSSSRYPSISSDVEDFHPLFGNKFGGVCTDFPMATLSLNGGLSRESSEDGTLELFRFFSETSHEYFSNDKFRKAGLGNMPSNIDSVTEILLFNSNELPYHRSKTVDNLVVGEPFVEESAELKQIPLPPPPESVLQGSTLSSTKSEDFIFRPIHRQVPSFSLPSSLPNLPMVAEISWIGSKSEVSGQSSIIPPVMASVASPNDVTILKSNSGLMQSVDEDSSISSVSEHDSSSQKSFSFKEDVQSRHSSLNQSMASRKTVHALEQNPNSKEVPFPQTLPPPPPPPLPPSLTPLLSPSSNQKKNYIGESLASISEADVTSRSLALSQIDSQRAALLASICDPGITLKKTGFLDYTSESKDSLMDSIQIDNSFKGSENVVIKPKPKAVNLLAEMATSLKMRRLSMQGAAHDKEQMMHESGKQNAASDVTSPSINSTKFTLPISNLQAYIAQRNEEQRNEELSEEEEWED
jgi:WAS family protein 1